jgi:hypothetical protein
MIKAPSYGSLRDALCKRRFVLINDADQYLRAACRSPRNFGSSFSMGSRF